MDRMEQIPKPKFVGRASRDTCGIHGWALEERAAIEAAFPGGMFVDALRLWWEVCVLCLARMCVSHGVSFV